ncbi:hypothetical protein MKW94_020178 [Papaver nudicaule]|uniref:Beta-catenin-like protein 1 N-terminal domain-containing protein n=1 Tax=Papaver nudicaule TaxID=74823 RepID=A0AA41VVW9_PAPNU|nr:hypothetical protein [Papaver nudicaule]
MVTITSLPITTTKEEDTTPLALVMASQKRYVPETPDQLQSSFQQTFDDYNKTRKYDEPCEIADLENKLIKIILKFRTFKLMYPKDYPKIVNLPAMGSMLELLKHDNYCGNRLASYILLAFKDLTNDNVLVENQRKGVPLFVEALIDMGALDVFVSTLERFRKDDGGGGGDGVFRALQTIAHMIFHQPNVAEAAGKKTELIGLLLDAIKTPRRGYSREYAVGLLHTLLLSSMENRRQLGEMGTVTVILNAISSLEDEDEDDEDEYDEEYVLETLFRCLFLLLEHLENRVRFADAGGVQLIIRIIQNEELGYYYYGSAVAALDIAVKDCQAASDKFVNDVVGSDIAIFPASMDIPPSTMHEKTEIEEHLVSLIALLTGGIAETQKYILLKKFLENECEKITWLVELFIRYFKQLEALMKRLKDKQIDPSELYNIQLRYGLPTLQLFAVILGYLWLSKNDLVCHRIETELSHHKSEKKHVRDILSEYRDHVGIGGESVEGAAKTVIEEYIDSLEEVSVY